MKREKKDILQLICVAACVVWGTMPANGIGLTNYNNDPDLDAAMKYDSEMAGGDRRNANQKLAEKYYLAYLEKEKNPNQRALVYVQLGALFSTNWHKEAGERPDYQKARQYFQEAIRQVPNGIGPATIRARSGMITPLQSHEERLEMRMELYRWLRSIDKEQAKRLWMPSNLNENNRVKEDDINTLLNLTNNSMIPATEDNVLGDARRTKDPFASLRKVAEAFPGTNLAKRANDLSQNLLNRVVDPSLENTIKGIDKGVPATKAAVQILTPVQPHDTSNKPATTVVPFPLTSIAWGMAVFVVVIGSAIGLYRFRFYRAKAGKK